MKKNIAISFFILVLLGGCTSKLPTILMEDDAPLAEYTMFKVMPVSNDTGQSFEFDVTGQLTELIKLKLKEKGYYISDEAEKVNNVLIIQSSLLYYKPGNPTCVFPGGGQTRITVRTSLLDQKTGKTIGELISDEMSVQGAIAVPFEGPEAERILVTVATAIADAIDKESKGE